MEIIPAPDFPTAGIIYGINGVKDGYRTGRGKVVMRAKCHFEDIDKGQRQAIIVDELPYQVNKKTLQERMAELVHEKKIEGISHIQDEIRQVRHAPGDRAQARRSARGGAQQPVQADPAAGHLRHQHGGADRRPAPPVQPQGPDPGLPAAPPRGRDPPHGVHAAQGARARPRAGRPGRRAGQYRRVHRHHPQRADAAGGQGRTDEPPLGQQTGARDAHPHPRRRRRDQCRRLPPGRAGERVRHGQRRPVPPVGHAGPGNPADAPAAPDRAWSRTRSSPSTRT